MAVVNMAFPVLPGKEDAARAIGKECMGPRKDQFDALQARGRITRETWTLQQTPGGTFVLVWFDTEDPAKAFEDVATATDDFTVWFRQQVLDISGVDMSQPQEGPDPELVLDWSS